MENLGMASVGVDVEINIVNGVKTQDKIKNIKRNSNG